MRITRRQLREVILLTLNEEYSKSENLKQSFHGMDYSNMSKDLADHMKKNNLDTRFKHADVKLMPFDDRYPWAKYVDYPSHHGKGMITPDGKKLVYIPPDNIPEDYVLPVKGKTRSNYLGYLSKMRPTDLTGKAGYVPKISIQEGLDMIMKDVQRTFQYGPSMHIAFASHPDNNKLAVLPPSFSIFLKFLKDRINIRNKKIDSGELNAEEVAKIEGFKNYKKFKQITDSFLISFKI